MGSATAATALLLAFLLQAPAPVLGASEKLQSLTQRLSELGTQIEAKHRTLTALEHLRTGILSGERIDLPSAERQHLERWGSHMIAEVTYDERHRPISTNASRHFQHQRTLANTTEVMFHTVMPLKKPSSTGMKVSTGPSALMIAIDTESKLTVMDPEALGEPLLGPMLLGHGAGRRVTRLAASTSHESHLILTADDAGIVRVHNLRVVARRENRSQVVTDVDSVDESKRPRMLNVTANLSCTFQLPKELSEGERPQLTALMPLERSEKTYFVTGDSFGGISVFHHNGTLKGRVRVTEDDGGVRGLIKGHNQMILFWSSHSFGSFSASQIDVQTPPCTGWNSPAHDVVLDPSFQSNRVVLALEDGDVIVFATTRGKSKACDLTMKFPHVSAVPFKLQVFRGHVMALTSPREDMPRRDDYLREIYFFNLAAMDNGYGAAPSRTITVQASFKPRQPESLAIFGDRQMPQLAVRFAGSKGIDVYHLSIKLPAALQAALAAAPVDDEEEGWWGWMTGWMPKAGLFGIALIGVVVWNFRKARQGGGEDFDEAFFQEQLRKAQSQMNKEERAKRGSNGPSRTRVEEVYDD